jgi:hypothetical protein
MRWSFLPILLSMTALASGSVPMHPIWPTPPRLADR